MARAMAMTCRWPPERLPTGRSMSGMTIPIFVSSSDATRFIVAMSRKGPLRISLPRKKLRHTAMSGARARSW